MVWNKENVLDISRIEVIFFTVAGSGLCLRSVFKTVLVIQRLFFIKAFSVTCILLTVRRLGMHKELGREHSQEQQIAVIKVIFQTI